MDCIPVIVFKHGLTDYQSKMPLAFMDMVDEYRHLNGAVSEHDDSPAYGAAERWR